MWFRLFFKCVYKYIGEGILKLHQLIYNSFKGNKYKKCIVFSGNIEVRDELNILLLMLLINFFGLKYLVLREYSHLLLIF